MCGLSGFLATTSAHSDLILGMTKIVRHRGPDDEGYVLFDKHNISTPLTASGAETVIVPNDLGWSPKADLTSDQIDDVKLAMGHRRLSIVDLSPMGHQPMSYKGDRYWITYNGEIYNYLELKDELTALGYSFVTKTDTEVILAAYDCWGIDCQSRLDGMWSIALYDSIEKKLFLSRDRFGIKPLYYWIDPQGTLFFGSEIKQFTVLPQWKARVNPQRAYDYLIWGLMDHTDETMFQGVYQIKGGHHILIDIIKPLPEKNGRLNVVSWYELREQPFSGNYPDAVSALKEKLHNSVGVHLRSDVVVGTCLSGGLDSTSIVCLMDQILSKDKGHAVQKTFSACSNVKEYDEKKWILQACEKADVEPYYTYPSVDSLFADSRKIIWHQDEPFGSTSIYAQWKVFELAAQNHVRVVLDGQGADEQLAGYHTFYAVWFYHLFKTKKFVTLFKNIKLVQQMHGYSVLHAVSRLANMMAPEVVRDYMKRKMGKPHKKPSWLDFNLLGAVPIDPQVALGGYTDSIQDFSRSQLMGGHLQALLHWEDRDSMAHGIEARVPFLDHKFVEFILGLPDEFKLSQGLTKKVLRDAMSGIIPDSIRDRTDKLGFVTPEEVWIRSGNTELFRSKMQAAVDSLQGIVRPEVIELFDNIVDGKQSFSFVLWRILNFAEWVDVFGVELPSAKAI